MTTKEEILALVGEPVGYMYEYSYDLNGDKQGNWPVEMHTHVAFSRSKPSGVDSKPLYTADQVIAARKPLEEDRDRWMNDAKTYHSAMQKRESAIGELHQQLAEKDAEIERLKAMVVMRFDHDTPPQFEQGYSEHEVLERVTAEHCRWFVSEIESLRKQLISANAEIERLRSIQYELIRSGALVAIEKCKNATGQRRVIEMYVSANQIAEDLINAMDGGV